MAGFDVKNDITPVNTAKGITKPTIAAMRTALNTYNSTSYSNDRLESMFENDLVYACRLHGLTVDGL